MSTDNDGRYTVGLEWITWGAHPAYADGQPIRLTSGSLPHCRQEVAFRRQAPGWWLVIRQPGQVAFPELEDAPVGCAECEDGTVATYDLCATRAREAGL